MNRILLEVIGISYSNSQNGAYTLLVGEHGAKKFLPIVIGEAEAQSIVIILENIDHPRPMTYDLMRDITEHYSIKVKEVVISKFKNGLFYSELHCEHDGKVTIFDARPSDAIALALHHKCPIYTYSNVIDEAGINANDIHFESDSDSDNHDEERSSVSIEELELMLRDAIDNEDYSTAAELRDIIKERKKTNQI